MRTHRCVLVFKKTGVHLFRIANKSRGLSLCDRFDCAVTNVRNTSRQLSCLLDATVASICQAKRIVVKKLDSHSQFIHETFRKSFLGIKRTLFEFRFLLLFDRFCFCFLKDSVMHEL